MFTIYRNIFLGAFASIFRARSTYLRVLALPIFCVTLVGAVGEIELGIFAAVLVEIVHLYFYTVIAVATHRLVLLGTDAVTVFGIYRWGKRELKFAVYILLLILVVFILDAVFFILGIAISPQGLMLVLILIVGIVVSRFSLVFPGIAIGDMVSFEDSWEMSRGYTLLMLCVVMLVPLVLVYPILVLEFHETDLPILSNLVGSIFLVFEIAFLSCAYNEIRKRKNAR